MDEIRLAINKEKMQTWGHSFDNWADLYLYISESVNWLQSHNKNYTKEQYNRIDTLKEILDCIDYGV